MAYIMNDSAYLRLDGNNEMVAQLPMGNKKVVNVADGVDSGDAVNKGQLDAKPNASDVYTKTEINSMLAGYAQLSGANFTGGVTSTADVTAFLGTAIERNAKTIQTEIIELDIMLDKANSRGYTELANEIQSKIDELEVELNEI